MPQIPPQPISRRPFEATREATRTVAVAGLVGSWLVLGSFAASRAEPAPKATPTAATKEGGAPLKVAFAYVGPVGDAGWTFAHDKARKAVEAEYGAKVVTSFVENVPEAADAERVIRDMVAQGNTLIFGTTFGYMQPMLKVAKDAKNVKFEHATGYKTAANLRTYDSRTYEGAYLAGVIAGGMTKSNVLGVVASIPIPEVIRNIDSFTLGAQSVNPKVETRVVWVNKWFDPPKESEGAQALLNDGADVLMQNTDSSAVLQAAEKAGKLGFGWDSDMKKFGPTAHLGSAVINWAPYYKQAVGEALDGKWKTGQSWWGVKEGAIDLVSISDKVPVALKQKVEAVKKGLRDGTFAIWKGPVADQDGKELLKPSQIADDKFLHGINFYVKGVKGKPPKGS
jgi:basic membrane protein A and related proteins